MPEPPEFPPEPELDPPFDPPEFPPEPELDPPFDPPEFPPLLLGADIRDPDPSLALFWAEAFPIPLSPELELSGENPLRSVKTALIRLSQILLYWNYPPFHLLSIRRY